MNENENRSYPIREDLTAIAANGQQLPAGVIADLAVSIEGSRTADVFVSSVSLTPNLTSIAIGAADQLILLASITGMVPHKVYRLEPQLSGISRYVAFGYRAKVSASETYVFDGPGVSGLSAKAVRAIEAPTVTALGQLNVEAPPLTGDIRLIAGSKITISRDGNTIKIGLQEQFRHLFVGPCDRLTEFITCGKPILREINGVGPDIDGKITIEVE